MSKQTNHSNVIGDDISTLAASKGNAFALFPILVFIVLYLGLGITFEYVLKISMGFYLIPVVVAFVIAIFISCLQNKKINLDQKLQVMALGLADKNIITMLFIFLLAGLFVGVVGRSSAESVAYCMLSWIPTDYSIAIIFLVSCFVSLSMGTSVGTITLITPIAVQVSTVTGFSLPLCVASVVGGAMFGDNLSFISDTTVAACNGQNCPMNTKFKENFKITIPAAILTLLVILLVSFQTEHISGTITKDYNLYLIIPYVIVLICGVMGINVFLILVIGIVSGIIFSIYFDNITLVSLVERMNKGTSGMFETCMVAILVTAMCSLIKFNGGFKALMNGIHRIFKGKKIGQLGIGALVSIMDIATANNTVAIVVVNPIAKEMAEEYGISPKKTASLLDTFSCIMQGIIPYGAQMLVAISIVYNLEHQISAFDIIGNLYYIFFLLLSTLFFIFISNDETTKGINDKENNDAKTV